MKHKLLEYFCIVGVHSWSLDNISINLIFSVLLPGPPDPLPLLRLPVALLNVLQATPLAPHDLAEVTIWLTCTALRYHRWTVFLINWFCLLQLHYCWFSITRLHGQGFGQIASFGKNSLEPVIFNWNKRFTKLLYGDLGNQPVISLSVCHLATGLLGLASMSDQCRNSPRVEEQPTSTQPEQWDV